MHLVTLGAGARSPAGGEPPFPSRQGLCHIKLRTEINDQGAQEAECLLEV